jgi:hypothetical protein
MTDGQTYDLEIAAYPLVSEVVEALVAIPVEIQGKADTHARRRQTPTRCVRGRQTPTRCGGGRQTSMRYGR